MRSRVTLALVTTFTLNMSYSHRDIQVSARILVSRHGLGALQRAELQVRRMERLEAFEAATTWRRLAEAIRTQVDLVTANSNKASG